MLAFGSRTRLDVLGITAVAGNVPVVDQPQCTHHLRDLRPARRRSSPAPTDRRPQAAAEHVHGKTGLDCPVVEEPTMALQEQHAVDFIGETLRREPTGAVTLCTLGPMTNIASPSEGAG